MLNESLMLLSLNELKNIFFLSGLYFTERFFLGPLAGASIFFVLTNFTVWAFSPMYPQTLEGLITAYILALPFFKNMILADFAFFTVFSGVLYLIFNFSDFKAKIFGLLHFSKKNKVSALF